MNFQSMEVNIHELIKDVIDHFSIYIQTKDGDISINSYEPKRAASTIKVPMLIESYRQIESGLLQPDVLVYIESDMKTGGNGVINYLTNSNVYSYKNLLELMIIVSDNTASNIILSKIEMHAVNEFATSVGCDQTTVGRKFMEDAPSSLDNYTSARDMVKFLHLIEEKNEILADSSREEIKKMLFHQQFNHKIPRYHEPQEVVKIYHKTGELPGIEHDVGIVSYQNDKIYMALLSENWTNNGTGEDFLASIGKIVLDYAAS